VWRAWLEPSVGEATSQRLKADDLVAGWLQARITEKGTPPFTQRASRSAMTVELLTKSLFVIHIRPIRIQHRVGQVYPAVAKVVSLVAEPPGSLLDRVSLIQSRTPRHVRHREPLECVATVQHLATDDITGAGRHNGHRGSDRRRSPGQVRL
jgi:hypothetical protein